MVHYRDKDIAIIGMAGRFPEANTLEQFWENLRTGKESIRSFPAARRQELMELLGELPEVEYIRGAYLEHISLFEPEYFNISKEECRYMDPQHRLILELVEESLQNAGYSSHQMAGTPVGVFTATTRNTYGRHLDPSSPMVLVNSLESALAGRIAYTFNFIGPTLNIDTACSSSLVALHYACQSLRNDECEYAVAGGVSIDVFPPDKTFAEKSPIWSPKEQVRAFDKDAKGSVGGEGGAVLLLKKLSKALEDGDTIQAIIKGSAVNSDGRRSNGLSAPNHYAQAEAIEQALRNAGVEAKTVSYIETHGTGTVLGDPIEAKGIQLAYGKFTERKQCIPIGSLKTNIGHLNPAAGVASVIKVILALQHRELPPSLHYEEPNPEIDFIHSPIYVNSLLSPWESCEGVRRAGITSLGLIGTNVHMILEEAPQQEQSDDPAEAQVFLLSALQPSSLAMMVENLREYVETHAQTPLRDIAYTLSTGRNHYRHRRAISATHREELLAKLQGQQECHLPTETTAWTPAPVFIYADWERTELPIGDLIHDPLIRHHYQECLIKAGTVHLPDHQEKILHYFACLYAFSQLLLLYGLKPRAVLGVGVGKYVAEVVKGKIGLEEGLDLAANHSVPDQPVDQSKLDVLIGKMRQDGHDLILNIGVKGQMSRQVEEAVRKHPGLLGISLDGTRRTLMEMVTILYERGVDLEWKNLFQGQNRRRCSLPTYPFSRRSFLVKSSDFHMMGKEKLAVTGEMASSMVYPKADFTQIQKIFADAVTREILLEEDFEDAGGDSLAVMQIAEMLKKEYHVSIPLDLFYTVSPVKSLIAEIVQRINQNVTAMQEGIKANVRVEAGCDAAIVEAGRKEKIATDARFALSNWTTEEPKEILLTGVTGFLGAFLIKDLLQQTSARIHCLVRARSEAEARERVMERIRFYHGHEMEHGFEGRIVAIPGDLVVPDLGLTVERYSDLTKRIDAIIHSAADVRHVGNYASLAKVNVEGTRYVLDFAARGCEKRFHHISTLAVAGYDSPGILHEDILEMGQKFEANVYAESKYAAEKVILAARQKGQTASIYRIGNLIGRYSDGVFQHNIDTNIFYNVLKALILLQQISPFLGQENLELLPIDRCTQAVTQLMLLKEFQGSTFHLTNPKSVTTFQMCEYMNELGGQIAFVDDDTFYDTCYRWTQTHGFHQEVSWIFNAIKGKNDANYRQRVPMKFDHTFSMAILDRLDFTWPEIDRECLHGIFTYTAQVGYMRLTEK